jgi:AraC-like DNA-binding protein/ligand-binding sensor protein
MYHYNFRGLTEYLKQLKTEHQYSLCVTDYAGFLPAAQDLFEALLPFQIHCNPFCMLVKSNRELWKQCVQKKGMILKKCLNHREPFYGMCYFGVGEIIIPIHYQQVLLGCIHVGAFTANRDTSIYRLEKVSRQFNMDTNLLREHFERYVANPPPTMDDINARMQIVVEYITHMYPHLASTHPDSKKYYKNRMSMEAQVLTHTIEYVHQHYRNNITLGDIAHFTHCSPSYISHLFKKNIKMNIKAYVNKLRIEQAMNELLHSNDNIAEIAIKVGFNDPNYFTSVFCRQCGISPSNYKKKFSLIKDR